MARENRRRLGTSQETAAAAMLTGKGYTILEHSHRNRGGEIDLIARDPDGVLVFVEIKYRRDSRPYDPLEAVDKRKQRRLSKAALWYFMEKGLPAQTRSRFDVIGITGDGQVRHIRDAFPYTP